MAIYKDVEPLEVVTYQGENEDFDRGVSFILEKIDALPTADVEEVVHSEWKLYNDGSGVCKNCKTHQRAVWDIDNIQRFCIRCGAKMDGGKAE